MHSSHEVVVVLALVFDLFSKGLDLVGPLVHLVVRHVDGSQNIWLGLGFVREVTLRLNNLGT